jgi:hypothetical protein
MPSKLVVSFEDDHIRVISDGDKHNEFVVDMWTQVAKLSREHQCFKVLGLANTTTPLEAVDGYDQARLFRDLNMPTNIRIAWVEISADAIDIASYIELVLTNRGYSARVFATEADARSWLLGD